MLISRLNLPNRITLSRLICACALFVVLALLRADVLLARPAAGWIALVLFLVCAGTDWLDGWLARRRGEVTVLGRIMDPFTDKVVVCGTFIFLAGTSPADGILKPWMVVIVVAREFLVNAIRGYMESQGVSFAAAWAGKVKMTLQCAAATGLLLMLPLAHTREGVPDWIWWASLAATWAAVVSTVYSGALYGRKAVETLKGERI